MHLLEARGLTAEIVDGSGFRHLLIERNRGVAAPRLHVYIEGDGTPWLTPTLPASDPTPTRALALELALLDSGAVIYLGRPCYFGVRDSACNVLTWTNARYSEAVVTSMAVALTTVARDRGYRRLVLIGHSGGGTLAVLLAERLAQVERVITIGANIDLAAWTRQHRFSPLIGSLDPATRTPAPQVRETHYVGARDRNVPPSLVQNAVAQRGVGEVIVVAHYDHVCCWVELWPDVLTRLAQEAHVPAAPELLMQKKSQ